MGAVLLTDVVVLDGSGAEPCPGEVLVQGNRIRAVAKGRGQIARERAAEVIDGRGMTLMPGMIEPHAHLSFVDQATPFAFTSIPVEEHLLLTLKHARLYLDQGFTSCFSAAATKPRLDIVTRDAIDRGEHPGPRLRAASLR